ncbi:hypothetical protein HG536_0H00610 [Torulaspora globosa]|uniref:Ubiquitin-like domain-containing protein n=1 Tax=Torulaspora globosa TaxID=48254 RepID=A0A7G3ZMF0_9SACH|nr:uncharacterized protein HG536_0H00610 [Torulaspora globosa]QLL34686.1 hypothetical protein HG536_0H00610 [Torulaspora globosa]
MSITVQIKSGQNKWQVVTEPAKTVAEFKDEIAKVSQIPAANQRLIYSGKILKDDQTVESYKIQDGHAIHLVKSGGNASAGPQASSQGDGARSVPSNIASGQTGGFNPLSDLTSARYAGFANLPSADMFGPDGGMSNMPNQEDLLGMLDNPIFQSQMNEMLSNPQMVDFMIQSNPQLQAMGPQARQFLQSPFFRQMLTNPQMIRQSMQLSSMLNPNGAGDGGSEAASFPAPGDTNTEARTGETASAASPGAAPENPFAALFNPANNPFAAMMNSGQNAGAVRGDQQAPPFDPSLLASLLGGSAQQNVERDNRPPEERYEQQLRQLNDMGFHDFEKNVAALRRSGGSVQGALDNLLNGDV